MRASLPSAALVFAALLSGCGAPARGAGPDVAVEDAFSTAGSGALAVYLDLSNAGGADEIVGAELLGVDAEGVSLHRTSERDGLSIMEPTDEIAVPSGTDSLEPKDAHLMLTGIGEDLKPGQTLSMRLSLRRSGSLPVEVRVVGSDEAVRLLVGESS